MGKLAIVIVAASLLSGCGHKIAMNTCTELGLSVGTPDFVDCYEHERDRRAALAGAIIKANAALYRRPSYQSATCSRLGNTVNCFGSSQ